LPPAFRIARSWKDRPRDDSDIWEGVVLKQRSRTVTALCIGVLAGVAAGGLGIATGDDGEGVAYWAEADILAPSGQRIGEAVFKQRSVDDQPVPLVDVSVTVRGLGPSAGPDPNKRGFHVHEFGRCTGPGGGFDAAAAGGHHDAGPFKNTTPVDQNHPYHLGDLPNLERRGNAYRMRASTSRFTLQPGHATNILDADGASVIVHVGEDAAGEGQGEGAPGPPGIAGGGRAACGVIERTDRNGDDDD
jgi:Cu/Zn superoxide dismutase